MSHYLLLTTGGTIGSTLQNGVIDVHQKQPLALLQAYEARYKHTHTFEWVPLLDRLSETFTPIEWERIISYIQACDTACYDAIILTHGTDTLSFTAVALSYFFHHLPLPIILVSSYAALDAPHSNALANFHAAVELGRQKIATGVLVAYQNPHESFVTIFYGAHLLSSLPLSSIFLDIQVSFARFENDRFTFNCIATQAVLQHTLKPQFHGRILYIKPFPGISYEGYDLEAYDAVLHDVYHSGTCDTQALIPFLEKASVLQKPVFIAPMARLAAYYQTTHTLLEHHVHPVYNQSIEAIYVKLVLLFGQIDDINRIKLYLETPLSFEVVV